MMLIEVGRLDITLDILFEAQAARLAANQSIAEHNAKIEIARRAEQLIRRERDWIAKNGPTAAWWQIAEPEEANHIQPPSEGAAA